MVRLQKLYEDEEVEVYRAPTDEELEQLVKDVIKERGRPLSWKELRQEFSAIAGEDRLRKVLIKLVERGEIIEMPDGTFGLPGMEKDYVPRSDAKRVRPLVPSMFRKRWGGMAAKLRKAGVPLSEALKMFGMEERLESETSESEESEERADVEAYGES